MLHARIADECPIIGETHVELAAKDQGEHHYHLYDDEPAVPPEVTDPHPTLEVASELAPGETYVPPTEEEALE